MQSTPARVPTAHDLLKDLFYLATPTLEEEKLCQMHKHEIPAILNSLKADCEQRAEGAHGCVEQAEQPADPFNASNQEGKYIVKKATKVCTRCGKEKSLEEFAKKNKEKLRGYCKQCDAERQRNFYKNNKKREDKQMTESVKTITKICTKCGKEKSLEEFNNDKRGKYGCKSICRECEKVQKSEYRASIKTCTPEPLKPHFDTDNFKRYLMSQIEFSKNVIQKMQGRIEAYQELISEL